MCGDKLTWKCQIFAYTRVLFDRIFHVLRKAMKWGYIMNLTLDQKRAFEKLKEFAVSNSYNGFLLKGYAGSGKTTLLSLFVNYLEQNNISFRILAPTGKAGSILREKTGCSVQTIHKAIYDFDRIEIEEIKQTENKENSKNSEHSEGSEDDVVFFLHFKIKQKKPDDIVNIYIVDESSLISDQDQGNSFLRFGSGKLLSDLLSFVEGSKIVFCGDHAQLPPISMNYSPALDEEYLRRNYGLRVISSELKEIVRTDSKNYIYNFSLAIRNSIEQKVFNELSIDENRKLSNELLVSELKRFYSIGKKFDDTIIIAHSNRQVQEYNFMVKRILNTNNKISDYEILPGDKLIVYKNYYSDDLTLLNGQSVEVVQILNREVIKTSEKEEVTYLDCQLKYYDYEMEGERVFKAKILNDYIYSPEPELDRKLYNKVFRAVLIKNLEFREVFNELKKTLREMKTSKTEKLVVLRDRYIALKLQISRILRDNEYFNPLLVKFGYAITCHKAQGSEWDNVIIDMKALNLVPRNEQYFRWLYTAVTRAKKEVYFINSVDINPFRGMRIGEVKIQKIRENGNRECNLELFPNRTKMVVYSLKEYGFKVLGVYNFQYMERFLFEYNSKKMQIDLYYN